jgi:NAD-dependent deacetylase
MIKKILDIKKKYDLNIQENISIEGYKPKLTVFTGAGISRESGLETFRDSDGLWNNHSIEEVATARAIRNNFPMVNDFYNMRRREVLTAEPNEAHLLLKQLESHFNVVIVTQNVDDLHERAGSTRILHLHGEIMKSRPIANTRIIHEQIHDIKVGERCKQTNSQLRPYIVLFNEKLDETLFYEARRHIRESDIFMVIGSSLQVNPAASLVAEFNGLREFYLIDPNEVETINHNKFRHLKNTATDGLKLLYSDLVSQSGSMIQHFKDKKGAL